MNERYSIEEIIALMEAMSKYKMGALKIKCGETSLSLKGKEAPAPILAAQMPTAQPMAPQQAIALAPAMPGQAEAKEEAEQAPRGTVVSSPIVGTFYAAPSPEKPPFATVGQQVKQGDVLFIIESMKLMNEVLSETSGTIAEILVENGQAVEYGQPIMRIE